MKRPNKNWTPKLKMYCNHQVASYLRLYNDKTRNVRNSKTYFRCING